MPTNSYLDIKRKHRRMCMKLVKRTYRNAVVAEINPGWHQGCMIGIIQSMYASGLVSTRQLIRIERICTTRNIPRETI